MKNFKDHKNRIPRNQSFLAGGPPQGGGVPSALPKSRLPQRLGRRLRRDIPLRPPQQLKPNHELPDRSRPKQRRIEVNMKVPLRMLLPIGRLRMKPHRIWERSIKNLIVSLG